MVQNGISVLMPNLFAYKWHCYNIFVIRAIHFSSFVNCLLTHFVCLLFCILAFFLLKCMSSFIDIKVVNPSSIFFFLQWFPKWVHSNDINFSYIIDIIKTFILSFFIILLKYFPIVQKFHKHLYTVANIITKYCILCYTVMIIL